MMRGVIIFLLLTEIGRLADKIFAARRCKAQARRRFENSK
jgi:hypothetical protein